MRVALLCSGGDCAGMNPAIKRFVEYSNELGYEPYFIYDGLEGLIENHIQKALSSDASGILHRGGTILRSSRSKRFLDSYFRDIAYRNLSKLGISSLVLLGGDGSLRALRQFSSEHELQVVGIPATIDNNVSYSDYSLGVDSALNIILESIDRLRDTASSFRRAFVVEVMGRDCGYLALLSAVSSGAEVCIVPEIPSLLEAKSVRLRDELKNGRGYILAIVSEGAARSHEVLEWLENDIGIEARMTTLGHLQRGGAPSLRDRLMGFSFMQCALDSIQGGRSGVVAECGNHVRFLPLSEVGDDKRALPQEILELAARMI